MGFRAIAFGTMFAVGGSFPFPNPIQTREAETGSSPFHVSDEAETKPWPSIILQTVPSIIETTLNIPAPSFHIGRGTRVLLRSIAQEPGTSLAWVLACLWAARCCLGPRGDGFALVFSALAAWPTPEWKGSARSQYKGSRSFVSDSGRRVEIQRAQP